MSIAKPTITAYGSSYGKYKGINITSYVESSDIDVDNLNKNLIIDNVEFNKFDQTIRDYVFAQLGQPVVRVELTELQVKMCIDEAITKLDYHAPSWTLQYAVFDASAGISVYELPAFIANNLSYVIYQKDLLAFQFSKGSLEFDFFLGFWQNNRFFQNMNVGDYLLVQQYMEMIRKVLSRDGTFDIINGRYLQLHPEPPTTPCPVILEYRAIDSNTILPAFRNWVQRYALACAKTILGRIRGKYQSIPGPGKGATLDGKDLVTESVKDKEMLMKELLMEIEEPPLFSVY
jgi:hypothetical protein